MGDYAINKWDLKTSSICNFLMNTHRFANFFAPVCALAEGLSAARCDVWFIFWSHMVNCAPQIVAGSSGVFVLSVRVIYLSTEVRVWNSTVAGALLARQPLHQGREFWCVCGGCRHGAQNPVSVIATNASAVLQWLSNVSNEVDAVVLDSVTQHILQQSRLEALPVGPLQESDAACCLEQRWPAALAGCIETASGSKKCLGGQLQRML